MIEICITFNSIDCFKLLHKIGGYHSFYTNEQHYRNLACSHNSSHIISYLSAITSSYQLHPSSSNNLINTPFLNTFSSPYFENLLKKQAISLNTTERMFTSTSNFLDPDFLHNSSSVYGEHTGCHWI